MNNAISRAKSSADNLISSVKERQQKQKKAVDDMLESGMARNPFLKSDGTLINTHLDYGTMLKSGTISAETKDMITAATGIEWRKTTGYPKPKASKKSVQSAKKKTGETTDVGTTSAKDGVSPTGNAIADTALGYIGVDYVWGGASPDGFDCSGLVQYVAKQNGINVSRTSQSQYKDGKKVSKDDLQPGDLVFFEGYTKSSTNPGHVGIYIGDGKYVQAPKTGDKVKVSNMSGRSDYVGARRIG